MRNELIWRSALRMSHFFSCKVGVEGLLQSSRSERTDLDSIVKVHFFSADGRLSHFGFSPHFSFWCLCDGSFPNLILGGVIKEWKLGVAKAGSLKSGDPNVWKAKGIAGH